MDDRVIQFRVGAVVICGLLVTGILILFSGDIDWIFKQPYTVYIETSTAPGVTQNTPVRKHGIRIGYVSEVQTLDRGVRLTLKIDGDQKLYANDVCRIGTASFLGDAVIDFLPGEQAERGPEIEDGTVIRNVPEVAENRVIVDVNPVEMISKLTEIDFSQVAASVERLPEAIEAVRDAGRSIETAGNNVAEITGSIQEALGGEELDVTELAENIRGVADKAENAIDNFNTLMTNVNEIMGDEEVRNSIRQSIRDVPEFVNKIELAIDESRETLEGFRQLAKRADKNLQNIESVTEALGEQGPDLIAQLEEGFAGANEIVDQLNQFSASLNNPNGSLGRLLNDPRVYQDLSQTLANIREVTFQLKPVVNDARYLMDGLSRDPGQLIRGAFDRRPNGSGYKGTLMGSDPIMYR